MKKALRLCVFFVGIGLLLFAPSPQSATVCQKPNSTATAPISNSDTMTDRQQIEALYSEMYRAMVEKDTTTLQRVLADEFVLVHMTGMRQPKKEYIAAIVDGTLNYYSASHEKMDIHIDGNHATLTGRSRVTAAVFGGGKNTWRLQLTFKLVRRNGRWQFTESRASTY